MATTKIDPRVWGIAAFLVMCIAFCALTYWVVSSAASRQEATAAVQEEAIVTPTPEPTPVQTPQGDRH